MSGRSSTMVMRQRSTRAKTRAASIPRPMNGIPMSRNSSEPPIEKSVLRTLTAATETNSPRPTARTARQVLNANGDQAKARIASSAPEPAVGLVRVSSVRPSSRPYHS